MIEARFFSECDFGYNMTTCFKIFDKIQILKNEWKKMTVTCFLFYDSLISFVWNLVSISVSRFLEEAGEFIQERGQWLFSFNFRVFFLETGKAPRWSPQ